MRPLYPYTIAVRMRDGAVRVLAIDDYTEDLAVMQAMAFLGNQAKTVLIGLPNSAQMMRAEMKCMEEMRND